jgi:hypothetical protein
MILMPKMVPSRSTKMSGSTPLALLRKSLPEENINRRPLKARTKAKR